MFLDNVVLERRAIDPTVYARVGGPGDIPLDKSELVAIFIETLTYGVEALTFVATIYLLHGATRNKFLLVKFSAVIVMFLMNTIHIGTSLRRVLNAFVGTDAVPVPDAADYLSDITGFLYRFKNILVVIQTLMLDILVVYRCYMVWDKKFWVVLVPSPSIIAYLATGIVAIHALAVYKNDVVFTGITKTWVSATLCVTLLTKLCCLVIVTLATVLPRPKSLFQTSYLKARLYNAALIAIESGGLAIISTLILVPVYLTGRNAQSILWGAMSPLTGESFLLIVMASLLGMTPSVSGTSRRRKGTIPSTKVTIPPTAASPTNSPESRFSVAGSLFKFPSSISPHMPSEYNKSTAPFSGPDTPRRYESTERPPFSTAVSKVGDKSDMNIHDALAYGEEKIMREARIPRRSPGERDPVNAFHIARSADGTVEVLQKERVAS